MAIELKKSGQKVNLSKTSSASIGNIMVNLNWNPTAETKKGLFGIFGSKSIDLDLGCLFELKDGSKGAVQALGDSFGSLLQAPYIELDGDDRTGASKAGENLTINGDKISEIKRILLYTFIYGGTPNWATTDGIVTIKQPNENIIIRMDEHGKNKIMCALALFENVNNETFSVERLVKYFSSHEEMDKAFNWKIKWVAGKK